MCRKNSLSPPAAWRADTFVLIPPARLRVERRRHRRYQTAIPIDLYVGRWNHFGHLLDLSASGACILLPKVSELGFGLRVQLAMPDGNVLTGVVKRHEAKCFGIELEAHLLDPTDLLHFDHMGGDFFSNVLEMQRRAAEMAEAPLKLQRSLAGHRRRT